MVVGEVRRSSELQWACRGRGLLEGGTGEGVWVDERSMQGQGGGKFHHPCSGNKARFHFLRSIAHLTIFCECL